ncbi:nuclear pore complex protein NUP205 isoform X2 [Aristolochia californica]|uniref:nuclear pore complex protein NUP205 isoform X2 n=1 Tax=Aristolochia californica TaxID=171875 RepID=UPI0035DB4361
MVSSKVLLSTIESALLGPSPTPRQRIELIRAIRSHLPSLKSLLSYPIPKASDRSQVQWREVRLPDSGLISLDNQDVQIALKLSDDLNLNEVDCVGLLVSANQEWGLFGRDPLEIYRLAAGLWYTERRDLITALYILLRAVVLDQGLAVDLVANIQEILEDLFNSGLRQRMINLVKDLGREDSVGIGGPQAEPYVLDSKGALVERGAVVYRERLSLSHCMVLSTLIVRMSPTDVKDVFSVLKDCASNVNDGTDPIKLQIVFSHLFSLVITFISDALSAIPDKASVLSEDVSFRREFQELVMVSRNDPNVEGFVNGVRLAWVVHLMLTQDPSSAGETFSGASTNDLSNIHSCLELLSSNNVFDFLLEKVLRTAAYQNDDGDMIYMYHAYMHKLIMCFLSHPLARDKVKEMKEKAMSALSPYTMVRSEDSMDDADANSQQISRLKSEPFVSLLELVSEIYQKVPELLSGNDVLWTFINFAGEDHTNFQTLEAFLRMLGALASSEESASKVFELLQGKTFRSVSWNTLFHCLSIVEQKFKDSLQSTRTVLPDFQEGDARALVAYLNVFQKVVENGNPVERKKWFPDIEPLFKLLSYENLPPYLKGALRNAIAAFIKVSPDLKDTIWRYLEQYDLPVVVGPTVVNNTQQLSAQVYDMQFELNEVEARMERYPSTISFLNLLNALIALEKDTGDRGRRFVGIFRFICDHVFGPFPQRAYADLCEKWQLVVACLEHFKMILSMYDISNEDNSGVVDQSHPSSVVHSAPLEVQLPILELLKDFMSGKTVFQNTMAILLVGVNNVLSERTSKLYGPLLEKAVQLALEILILVFDKDLALADYWRPLYQPLDVILFQEPQQIVALLEYVRYDFLPQIQVSSIEIMSILSARLNGLVQLLLKSNAANCLIEDYAACLELRSEEQRPIENTRDDVGVLILQLLTENISRPAPNIAHLLLKFDMDAPVERTALQPKYHYSCLKIILDILEKLAKPDVNALLHEFGFQLLYELCLDPLTGCPTMDLLSTKRYHFFSMHLGTIGVAPLPKRNNNQILRISSLQQRAWLLKLLALELHIGDMNLPSHREACMNILGHLFVQDDRESGSDSKPSFSYLISSDNYATEVITKSKVFELLQVLQFRSPDTSVKYKQIIPSLKYDMQVDEILGNPTTSDKGGVYYYSERGDRLIDLVALREKLWQMCNFRNPRPISVSEADLCELRESIHDLLKWGWKYNKNLEEQAAQLHMLSGWSQIVEVAVSRRMAFLENRSQTLFGVLDSSLSASASPDCSLKMAITLTQVGLTCMAKLRDERFLSPGGVNSDNVTCLDIILGKQLPNGACHSILFKLILAIMRHESSESLRRRQYALLLSYFQYCQSMFSPDIPASILQYLLRDEQDGEGDLDLQKVNRDQAELVQANFSILKKEAQAVLDVVTKDAIHGSETGKAISLYVLDAFISIDQENFFLSQLQSRGFLRICLTNISNFSYQDSWHTLDSLRQLHTRGAELALLLRISHNYGKLGAQVLFSMDVFEHLTSCRLGGLHKKGSLRRADTSKIGKGFSGEMDRHQLVLPPILRLVSCLTSLVDASEFLEVSNKVVRQTIDFIKGHQSLFAQILRVEISESDELTLEQINLAVAILNKVWPYEENDDYGLIQGLFGLMNSLFHLDVESLHFGGSHEYQKKSELSVFWLYFSLSSYLYFLVTKKRLRLQVSDGLSDHEVPGQAMQPTLISLVYLLGSVTIALEKAAEEKSLLLNKIEDINELSRQEVDEIINMYMLHDCILPSDNIRKRRYIAMVGMCQTAGNREQLIHLLLQVAEHVLNIFVVHFQESPAIPESRDTSKMIVLPSSRTDSREDLSFLCTKLFSALERLELLSVDKVGRSLKMFRRLLSSLKEMTVWKLSS